MVSYRHAVVETDRDLILACREGQTRAWRRLLSKYERIVFSIPLRYGLSREDAADVSQLTFTSLIKSMDRLREDSNLGAWLSTVARRHTWRMRSRDRRERASEFFDETELLENALHLGRSDVDSIEHWELAEWLDAGLSELGGSCRDLLLALYFHPEQSSYAEVAARLNVPIGSIGPTRARCLKRLRRVLDEG